MQSGLLLNVIVLKTAAIFNLLAGKYVDPAAFLNSLIILGISTSRMIALPVSVFTTICIPLRKRSAVKGCLLLDESKEV